MNVRLMRSALAGLLLATSSHAATDPHIRFSGNDSFGAAQLLGILRNRYHVDLRGDFAVTDADDAAYFLREFYFSQGYRTADVEYDYEATRPPGVEFLIDEGLRRNIGRVSFEGGPAIPRERLAAIFNAAIRTATLRPLGRVRLVDRAIEAGRAAIVEAYAREGYLLASAEVIQDSGENSPLVDLTVQIDQGVAYSVRDVTFSGAPVPDADLRGVLADFMDRPYRRNQEMLMQSRLADWLRNRGYLNVAVTATSAVNDETGTVAVAFSIVPGQVYTIGDIQITGAENVRAREVLSRFAVKPGTTYDASQIDEAARRLWFTGAFSEANVERVPHPDGTVDLVLELKRAPAKRLQFGGGYSQWDRAFGEIHYLDRNFLGSLNRFSVDTFVSQRSYGIATSLADPWFLGSEQEGAVGAFFARRELPAYRSLEYGGTLSLTRRYTESSLTGYRLQYGWKRVTDSVIFGDDGDDPDPNYTLGNITFSQTYDTRNSILSPMKGLYLHHEVEAASPALLGEISYFRIDGQATWYLPFREITTDQPFVPFLVANHRVGMLFPYGNTSVVPIQERFFLGGPTSVRSYQLDGLGPKDRGGDPTGGLASVLFNLEVQWPVFNNIYLAAFADAGNIWDEVEDIQPTDLQVGIGPGLRLYTPLGAVRVDYGYNVNRQIGDPIGAWQIGFGFTF